MNLNSVSNSRLTLLRKLKQKKYRYSERLFLVEGDRAVEQIIENGQVEVQDLFFDANQQYWQQQRWEEHLDTYSASTIEGSTYAEVSDTDNPQGVIAVCVMPDEFDPGQLAAEKGIVLATDGIQDPGNLGTIIRTASWFGAAGLLSGKGTVDMFHPKVVRSTAGATGMMPHANVELHEALPVFEQEGWEIILLDAGLDAVPLQQVQKKEKMVVVIGNEAHGINELLFAPDRQKARIASPRKEGAVESLNAAIATSISLYALS